VGWTVLGLLDPLESHGIGVDASTRRKPVHGSHRFDTGNGRQAFGKPLLKAPLVGRLGKRGLRQVEPERRQPLGSKAGIDALHGGEAADQKPRTGDQRDGKHDLHHHEGAAQEMARRAGRGSLPTFF